jgi:hypothetical protein
MTTDYGAETWGASDLLTEVYRECRLPSTGSVDYPAAVVLREATDAIRNFAQHQLAKARDGRITETVLRVAPTDARDSFDRDYELPPLGVGDSIDGIDWVDSAGRSWPLTPIPLQLESTFFSNPNSRGTPAQYALLAGLVRVFPTPDAAGSLRITFQRRHPQLATADSGVIQSFAANGSASDITLTATAPASILTGLQVDIFGAYHPHRTKLAAGVVTNVAGAVVRVAVSTTVLTDWLVTGDTLVLRGRTPYVHLPMEMRKPLTQWIASVMLDQMGDPAWTAKEARAERGMAKTAKDLEPRAKAQPTKAFNPNSLFRQGSRRRAWWQVDG